MFWFNIIVDLLFMSSFSFCALHIADFYHDERLVSLCRLAFINILFSSLGTACAAFLFKQHDGEAAGEGEYHGGHAVE